MSTAKKRTIKYVSLIASLILVFSYFSLLSPTSAYFYKKQSSTTTLEFAMFDVDAEQTLFENDDIIKFKGATKLCDTEELLFDEVAIVKEVTLINKGEAPARILVNITPDEESVTNGLRYVAFAEKVENAPETAEEGEVTSTTVTKGALKQELETLFGITAESESSAIESAINAHNESLRNTNGNNNKTIIAPGERAKVRIVFWVEYDKVQTAAGGESVWQNAGEIKNITFPCNIRIMAVQDDDEAVEDALTEKTTVEETTTEATSAEETTVEVTTEQQ